MADPRFFKNLGPFDLARICEAAALTRLHEVGHRGHGERHEPAGGDALDHPGRDEEGDALRETARGGREEEERQRRLEQRLAPMTIAELAPERGGRGVKSPANWGTTAVPSASIWIKLPILPRKSRIQNAPFRPPGKSAAKAPAIPSVPASNPSWSEGSTKSAASRRWSGSMPPVAPISPLIRWTARGRTGSRWRRVGLAEDDNPSRRRVGRTRPGDRDEQYQRAGEAQRDRRAAVGD